MPRTSCTCSVCIGQQHAEALRIDEEGGSEVLCDHCEIVCAHEELTALGGNDLCAECYADLAVNCLRCDVILHREDDFNEWVEAEEGYLCEHCYYDYFFRCYRCEGVFNNDDMQSTDEGAYCEHCAQEYLGTCERCGESVDPDNLYSRDNEYELRVEAGYEEEGLEYWLEDEYEDLCERCARAHGWLSVGGRPEPQVIRDYSYKPAIEVRINEQGLLFSAHKLNHSLHRERLFGLELEVERGLNATLGEQAAAKNVIEMAGGLLYCKRDSSITSGFEVVSHPGVDSFWLRGQGREIFTDVLAYLRAAGYRSEGGGRCGFHIHTSKNTLTRLHKYNLARFLHDPRMRMFFFGLSRRSEGQLSSYSVITLPETARGMDSDLVEYAKRIAKGGQNTGRSTILNLQGPTAELRLFRGTLDKVKFWADFQFFNSVLNYTDPKQGNLGLRERPTWASFRQFVESYPLPHEVAELRTHLKELGI